MTFFNFKQQETFNTELEFVRREIKKLPNECTDLRGQLKQAQKQINSIDNQLKPSPPTSSVKQITSPELPQLKVSWEPLPSSFTHYENKITDFYTYDNFHVEDPKYC